MKFYFNRNLEGNIAEIQNVQIVKKNLIGSGVDVGQEILFRSLLSVIRINRWFIFEVTCHNWMCFGVIFSSELPYLSCYGIRQSMTERNFNATMVTGK